MKKIFVFATVVMSFSFFASAQDISPNAIGLRIGDSDALGIEVSYQRALSAENRLELDLGWRDGTKFDGFKLAGLYQWVWILDGNFNWYAGVGGGFGAFSYNDDKFEDDDNESFLFAAGNIGIEYDFDIPLLISLDFRPEIGFGADRFNNNDLDFDIALGIRYQF